MFVLGQKWISSYRKRALKYCSSILSNLICASPGGTVRHNHNVKQPVRLGIYGNKTVWFTCTAIHPYPKVCEKADRSTIFVHLTYVTLPITRVCQLVSHSDMQYITERKHTAVQCNAEISMLFLWRLFNKWEAAVFLWTLELEPFTVNVLCYNVSKWKPEPFDLVKLYPTT